MLKGNFKYLVLLIIPLFFIGKYLWKMPKYDPGKLAPTFSIPALDGHTLTLESFQGKVVLLDFWGSWCGPCRAQSPDLVTLYDKWNDKGLEILSIAMDKSEARWKAAIIKDEKKWKTHGSNLERMNGEVGALYGIREIPTKYLIDQKGYIIATNPTFEEIDRLLNEKLSK